jgi:hypothetical protein
VMPAFRVLQNVAIVLDVSFEKGGDSKTASFLIFTMVDHR